MPNQNVTGSKTTTPRRGASSAWLVGSALVRAPAASDRAELATLRAIVQAMRIMVGIVFAATVFDNLRQHGYTEAGYRRTIDGYLAHGDRKSVV